MAGAVIPFGDPNQPSYFYEDPDDLERPLLKTMLKYWRAARETRSIPLYADFNPKDVKAHLPWIVVIDALPGYADFRYRVIGTKVCDYYIADGTGKTVTEAFGELTDLADNIKYAYRRTCELALPIRCTGPATTSGGVFFPAYDTLFLPYSRDGETADCIVNAFSFSHEEVRMRRAHSQTSLVNASRRKQPAE